MTNSSWDGRSRAPLRIGLILVALFEYIGTFITLRQHYANPLYIPQSHYLLAVLPPNLLTWILLLVVGVGGLVCVAFDRHTIRAGFAALACMVVVSEWTTEILGSPSHNFFYPGSILLGWLVGLLLVRDGAGFTGEARRELRESAAEAGAVGVIAALYVGSGVSKLLYAGFGWADMHHLRTIVLAHPGIADVTWVDAFRSLIIEHPRLAQAFSVSTLVIELGAFLLLYGGRMRALWSLLIFGMHLQVLVLANIFYLEPLLLVPLFGFPWPAVRNRTRAAAPTLSPLDVSGATEFLIPRKLVTTTILLYSAAWLFPVRWGSFPWFARGGIPVIVQRIAAGTVLSLLLYCAARVATARLRIFREPLPPAVSPTCSKP